MDKRYLFGFRVIRKKGCYVLILSFVLISCFFSASDVLGTDEEIFQLVKMIGEIAEVFDKRYYQHVSSKMMLTDAAEKMIRSADPYAYLLPPDVVGKLEMGKKNYGRINMVISLKNGMAKVVSPIQGTHAFESGIMTGDRIVGIDGKPVMETVWRFKGGDYGSTCILTVIREGTEKPIDIKTIRDSIAPVSIASSMTAASCAYIRISYFQNMTADRFGKIFGQFKHADIPLKSLILDLRYNPGGLLTEAITVSDYFLEKGVIASVKSRIKKNTRTFYANSVGEQPSYPIMVLINKGTAGVTEIVAGALQDHRRAFIMGTPSYGLGSVQNVEILSNGYGVRFTIAEWFTSNGHKIEGNGITPDVFFDPSLNIGKNGKDLIFSDGDVLIKAATEILKKSPSGRVEDMSVTAEEVMSRYRRRSPKNDPSAK